VGKSWEDGWRCGRYGWGCVVQDGCVQSVGNIASAGKQKLNACSVGLRAASVGEHPSMEGPIRPGKPAVRSGQVQAWAVGGARDAPHQAAVSRAAGWQFCARCVWAWWLAPIASVWAWWLAPIANAKNLPQRVQIHSQPQAAGRPPHAVDALIQVPVDSASEDSQDAEAHHAA
jgi:hypothetical protein